MTPGTKRPRVCIVLREIAGGVVSMMSRWAERSTYETDTTFILLRDTTRPFTALDGLGRNTRRLTFDGRLDNRHLMYKRIAAAIPGPDAFIVANDAPELGMISALGLTNPVAFALHGHYEFYYKLALEHQDDIGSFLCVSRRIHDTLCELLPGRQQDIHVTYPIVPNAALTRAKPPLDKALRLLFVGRLTEEKGFLDLPHVDSILRELGIPVRWTVIAPAADVLASHAAAWLSSEGVTHLELVRLEDMESLYVNHDILVFPSRFEGFGMAVLESMKCGMVPVVSRLDAGIPEMIEDGETGFVTEPGDYRTMASRIATLWREPARLTSIAAAAQRFSQQRFDAAAAADRLTSAILATSPRSRRKSPAPTYLSRLDKPWLPNPVVRLSRRLTQRYTPTPAR